LAKHGCGHHPRSPVSLPATPSNVKDVAEGKSFTFIAIVMNAMGTLVNQEKEIIEAALEESRGMISALPVRRDTPNAADNSRIENQKPAKRQAPVWARVKVEV
jgi:hypothetical protein